jgi:hypothetical protein
VAHRANALLKPSLTVSSLAGGWGCQGQEDPRQAGDQGTLPQGHSLGRNWILAHVLKSPRVAPGHWPVPKSSQGLFVLQMAGRGSGGRSPARTPET